MIRIGIIMPEGLLERLDDKRGDVNRSRFIVRVLEDFLGISEKERAKYE